MIRHAWRTIVRAPIVSAVIVLSLAAGIGINTVVFSWIQSRMVKPMPAVDGSARFYGIEARNAAGMYPASSWLEYQDLASRLQSFDALIASRMMPLYVGEPGDVQRAYGVLASGNYFEALALRPAVGRLFTDEDSRARVPVAVIAHDFWQARFGGRADIAGQRLRANGIDLTIVGVAPRGFRGTVLGLSFDVWMPATLAPVVVPGSRELEERAVRGYSLVGRLKADISVEQARQELRAAMSTLEQAYPQTNTGISGDVLAFWDSPRGPNRMINVALMALQIIMLLLLAAVCGNTANLVLARASARHREMGVRLALGAGPRRVALLLVTENVMLGVIGALGGAALAVWGTNALKVLPMAGLPIRMETSVDSTALAFAIVLGVASGALIGLLPAWNLARLDPSAALRAGARTAGRSRVRNMLMAAQVGLAMLVLITASMSIRSFMATRTEETGFRRDGVMLAAYDFTGRAVSGSAQRLFADRLLQRVRALPGVEHAAVAGAVPLDIHGLPMRAFTLEGRAPAGDELDEALTNTVSPGYFATMGIPLRDGRDFAPLGDVTSPMQAIVNETFVRDYIGSGSAVGRTLEVRGRTYVITGVVADSLSNAFGEPPTPVIYFSYRDRLMPSGEIHVAAAPGAAPASIVPGIRAIVRELDPELPLFNVRTLQQHIDSNLVFRRVPARMFAVLAPMLLVLASIGIYAVVAYSVSLRTQEIGVRMALGSSRAGVVRTLVGETMTVIAAGAAIGWLAAVFIATDAMGAGSIEPAVFGGVPVVLMAVAALASWLPARKAASVDPWAVLR